MWARLDDGVQQLTAELLSGPGRDGLGRQRCHLVDSPYRIIPGSVTAEQSLSGFKAVFIVVHAGQTDGSAAKTLLSRGPGFRSQDVGQITNCSKGPGALFWRLWASIYTSG